MARQKLYKSGDKPGRYLANIVKKRADSQNIVSITYSNGVRSFDTRTINKHFASFYSNLYSSKQPYNALTLMCQFSADLRLPKATDDQKLQINVPTTREEALLALKSMPSGKTQGRKEFSGILLDPLLSMLNHSFENGTLPQSLREDNISLIVKKGKCPDSCASYRLPYLTLTKSCSPKFQNRERSAPY